MITVTGLHKYYNRKKATEFHALRGIDFCVNDGELLAVIGKSGAGKSTLLHILGAIDSYDEGSYRLDDVEVKSLSGKKLAEFRNKNVGIVLQDFALVEGYSVLDNVMIPLRFGKKTTGSRKALALEALRQVDMEGLASKDVNKLSGGQKQRVAIARAIVNSPDFILADEPTGALDTENTRQIMDVFKKLNAQGKTIIIITHDPEVASQCSRVLEISDGMLLEG